MVLDADAGAASSDEDLSFNVVLNYRSGSNSSNKSSSCSNSPSTLRSQTGDDSNSSHADPAIKGSLPGLPFNIFALDLHTLSLKELTDTLNKLSQYLVTDFIKANLLDLPLEEESLWKQNADLVANHLILMRFYWKLLQTKRKKAMKLRRLNKKLQSA